MLTLFCKWIFLTLTIQRQTTIRNVDIKSDIQVGEIITILPPSYGNASFPLQSNIEKYFEVFQMKMSENTVTGLRLKMLVTDAKLREICPLLLYTNTTTQEHATAYLAFKIVKNEPSIPTSKDAKAPVEVAMQDLRPMATKVHRRTKRWDWKEFDVTEEMEPPQLVFKLKSTFDNRTGSVLYFMEGEGAGTIFKITEGNGRVETLVKLDREEKSTYQLKIYATDLHHKIIEGPSTVIVKVLDMNDQQPVFERPHYYAKVEERAIIGTDIIAVKATDKDDNKRPFGQLRYSIVGGSNLFAIHPKTGMLRTKVNNLDREQKDEYKLVIEARDTPNQILGFSTTTNVTIQVTDVNDSPPRFPLTSYHELAMENLIIGEEIARLTVTDRDLLENKATVFSLEGEDAHYFSVESAGNMAIINVAKKLDYESARSHQYKFKVIGKNLYPDERFDYINLTGSTDMVVGLIDVNEPPEFTETAFNFHVREDAKVGTNIDIPKAIDPEGDAFVHQLLNHKDVFTIDTLTGMITLKSKLDREKISSYDLIVQAGLAKDNTAKVVITIDDVNDNPPEPLKDNLEVILCIGEKEKRQVLEPLIEMKDPDDPKTGGKPFHFFPTMNNNYRVHFDLIDNGDSTASLRTKHNNFRFSEKENYQVPVVVSDSGSPQQNATYIIMVRTCYCSADIKDRCGAAPIAAGMRLDVLVPILVTVAFLLFIVIIILLVRRRRQRAVAGSNQKLSLYQEEEDDIRENVITYNEEGGGEEDTAAYDITALSMAGTSPRDSVTPIRMKMKSPVRPHRPESCDMHSFIESFKGREDGDAQNIPFDSIQVYSYEGNGSLAGSLSSIASCGTDDGDQVYDYVREWGPRFTKLANIYDNAYEESDEDEEIIRPRPELPYFNYTFSSQGSVRRGSSRQKPRLVRTATHL